MLSDRSSHPVQIKGDWLCKIRQTESSCFRAKDEKEKGRIKMNAIDFIEPQKGVCNGD